MWQASINKAGLWSKIAQPGQFLSGAWTQKFTQLNLCWVRIVFRLYCFKHEQAWLYLYCRFCWWRCNNQDIVLVWLPGEWSGEQTGQRKWHSQGQCTETSANDGGRHCCAASSNLASKCHRSKWTSSSTRHPLLAISHCCAVVGDSKVIHTWQLAAWLVSRNCNTAARCFHPSGCQMKPCTEFTKSYYNNWKWLKKYL